jgi:hypothetical protein
MKACRLIYTSISTAEVVSNETLSDLETKASANNLKEGITGLLVLAGNVFVQVLEGSARDITRLFGRIIADKRHNRVELVTFEPVQERYFDDWNMRLVDLYDLPGDKRQLMASKYAGKDGNVTVPTDVHQIYAFLFDVKNLCLSEPWKLPEGSRPKSDDQAKSAS